MSSRVAILTDGAAALPAEMARSHNVTVVPSNLTIGDRTVPDCEVALDDLIEFLPDRVSTSVPTPMQFREVVGNALDQHDEAIVLTVASKMSTTFDAARLGCEPFGERVRVIDTNTAAGAQALVVLAAARAAEAGADSDAVADHVAEVAGRVRLIAAVGSLAHLMAKQRGRIPSVIRTAGGRLRVVPLFEFREGQVRPRRPALTKRAAFERIVDACHRGRSPGGRLHLAALHATTADDAERLLAHAADGCAVTERLCAPFSPSMVVHTGPDVTGLAWWWEA